MLSGDTQSTAAQRVEARITGTRFGPVQWFDRVDSTNRVVLDEAARSAPAGLVAVADEQTAGRGRLGRTWSAPAGASLLVSILLRPQLAPERLARVTLATGLATIAAVRDVAGIAARLKWPNDVLVGDRKLAGILAEKVGEALVVGAGVNVAWDAFPPDLAATATACNLCSHQQVSREDLLVRLLRHLDARLGDLDQVVVDARAASATLGRRVRVETPGGTFDAVAIDLTDEGHLVVRRDDDTEMTVAAADVVHLRDASF